MSDPLFNELKGTLSAYEPKTFEMQGFRAAAVLVPLLRAPAGLELLFTVRSGDLNNHAGQVAFPGGRVDEGESLWEAARRETFEEVGLEVSEERFLGYLDDHPSPARYSVTPHVALLEWPQRLTLNPGEVDTVFTVPLKTLLELKPYTERRSTERFSRTLHFYPYGERLIWGLTGNVLKNLLDLIRRANVRLS